MTPQQTDFIYKKVELGSLINQNTIKEELDADIELDRMDDNSGDEKPYKELIINNAYTIENALPQMEQWSILSKVINYVHYNKDPKKFHSMMIRPVKCNKAVKDVKGKNVDESLLEVNLVDNSDRFREEYLDKYEGVKSEIVDTTRFDKNSDLSMTYLRKINMTLNKNLMVEQRFPISKLGYTLSRLLDETECQILLDTGASINYLCPNHIIYAVKPYIHCQNLHQNTENSSR